MNDQNKEAWGERLAAESVAAGTDEPKLRRLLTDAVGVVRGRLGEVSKGGIRPLLDEAAAQVRPATLEELRARYPGLPDDEVAKRLIDRAAKTAAGLAMLVGGVVAAQQAPQRRFVGGGRALGGQPLPPRMLSFLVVHVVPRAFPHNRSGNHLSARWTRSRLHRGGWAGARPRRETGPG